MDATLSAPKHLRWFNDTLSVLIVLIAAYIFLLPVLPQLSWWAGHSAPLLSNDKGHDPKVPATTGSAIPKDNRLLVPALDLNEPIYEGASVATVDKGIWLRPNASTPNSGSNTVLVGHRFTYTNPRGVFYFLDKVRPGDILTVYWHGQAYSYKTREVSIVDPTDAAVEAPTDDSRLTLYTCTPLWSLKQRLVVVADRIPS